MINFIKANGFRSLSNQQIEIENGINAFVGPNGAGKTNILTALDFIANLIDEGTTSAINKAGGISGVFQRKPITVKNKQGIKNTINFSISGSYIVKNHMTKIIGHNSLIYFFEYAFTLRINKHNIPYLTSQNLVISALGDEKKPFDKPITALRIEQNAKNGFFISEVSRKYILDMRATEIKSDKELLKYLNNSLINSDDWQKRSIFDQLTHYSYLVWLTKLKLVHSERLAINPDKIKSGDEITSPLEILNDGSGTIRTLHALKNGYLNQKLNPSRCKETYNEIINELRLAVENIHDLIITEDTATARYILNLQIKTKDNEIINIPANFASEGTLKWLVIITFIKTGSIFSLEEPENFLHPWMQIELVRLLREQKEKWPLKPILLSTHSETLLNELKSDEIIVTYMKDGVTRATRAKNAKNLDQEIKSTGFNLGHYYVSGAIDYE